MGESAALLSYNSPTNHAPLTACLKPQVGPDQNLFLALLAEFNLTTFESPHALGTSRLVMGGFSLEAAGAAAACWDCLALPRDGDAESLPSLLASVAAAPPALRPALLEVLSANAALGEIAASVNRAAPWLTKNAAALDGETFRSWVLRRVASPLAVELLFLAVSEQGATNAEAGQASVLHVARQLACAPQSQRPEARLVRGGAGQLPALLAADVEAAGGTVVLSAPVRAIEHGARGVLARAGRFSVSAKRAVVAMPPHLAGRIAYAPPLPAGRDQLTQRVFMPAIIKALAVYETPFWRANSTLGHGAAGAPAPSPLSLVLAPGAPGLQLAYDVSPPGPGGPGVLATFFSQNAPAYLGLAPAARRAAVLASFASWFGAAAAAPLEFVEKDWPAGEGSAPATAAEPATSLVKLPKTTNQNRSPATNPQTRTRAAPTRESSRQARGRPSARRWLPRSGGCTGRGPRRARAGRASSRARSRRAPTRPRPSARHWTPRAEDGAGAGRVGGIHGERKGREAENLAKKAVSPKVQQSPAWQATAATRRPTESAAAITPRRSRRHAHRPRPPRTTTPRPGYPRRMDDGVVNSM